MALELTSSFEVVDRRFRRLALPYIHVEKLYTGCRWAEGPAWFAAGRYLVWSDIPNDRMLRWDETDGSVSVFRQPSMNSNGHTVDLQGRLVSCEHLSRCVSRTEFDGKRTVLADRYDGRRLNSPNDVVVRSDGSVWFTDPSYGIDSDYEGDASPSEIGANNVYRIDPANGRVTIVASDFVQPNGLAFSPDGKRFYVDDDEQRNIHVYDVGRDGTLSNGRVFGEEPGGKDDGVPDGIKVDEKGNLFVTGPKGIWVWDPQGHHLGTIVVPEQPANLTWGEKDYRTLYITATSSVYRLQMKTRGFVPYLKH